MQLLNSKERNIGVDIIRGIAMLMVVIGHTISGSSVGYETSLIYKVIWSLQMPLFMVISGYVNKFGKGVDSGRSFAGFLLKRTIAYLLPFVVWSFLIRGFIFGQKNFLDLNYLIYHIDSGYWFLFSLWTITVVFGFSLFIGGLFKNLNGNVRFIIVAAVYFAFIAVLFVSGRFVGMTFLGLKLTLYYSVFYFAGYAYGIYQEEIHNRRILKICEQIIIAICWGVWILLIKRYDFFEAPDTVVNILLRAIASFSGCIAVCGTCAFIFGENKVGKALSYVGIHSLEIYLIHYLFLNVIKPENLPIFYSLNGVGLVLVNLIITLAVTLIITYLLNINKYLRLFAFGKLR